MKNALLSLSCLFFRTSSISQSAPSFHQQNILKPYGKNEAYWQYNGAPVLLPCATRNDNLFQNKNVKSHRDSLKNPGGNYIRNTMSDRDAGDEKVPGCPTYAEASSYTSFRRTRRWASGFRFWISHWSFGFACRLVYRPRPPTRPPTSSAEALAQEETLVQVEAGGGCALIA